MVDEFKSESSDASLDEDLYCIECGYNLRGLPGDPRRCPECGHQNPLSELTLPAEIIRAHLTKLESAPTFAFASTLMVVLGALAIAARANVCAAVLVLTGVLLLLTSIQAFGRNSRWRPGWFGVLSSFFIAGACIFTPVIAGYLVCFVLLGNSAVAALGLIGLAVLMGVLGWPLYARAKRQLAALQRATAVELAKEAIAQRLHRRR